MHHKMIPIPIAILSAVLGLAAASSGTARADVLIQPVSVTGSGSYVNNADLIIDGVLPPRFTPAASPTTVSWNSLSTTFTINLGGSFTLTNLTAYVDNNDTYVVQSSTDGVNFKNLFTFLASDGPVTPAQGGSDILTTIPADPTSPGDTTTPAYVGRGFAPVEASYVRLFATSGDSVYSVGELQIYAAVPEPSSLLLAVAGGSALACAHRARRRKAAG